MNKHAEKPIQRIKCPWHKPSNLPYMAFFADAEKRAKKGQEQKQCPDCLYYFWPHEFGRKPRTGKIK